MSFLYWCIHSQATLFHKTKTYPPPFLFLSLSLYIYIYKEWWREKEMKKLVRQIKILPCSYSFLHCSQLVRILNHRQKKSYFLRELICHKTWWLIGNVAHPFIEWKLFFDIQVSSTDHFMFCAMLTPSIKIGRYLLSVCTVCIYIYIYIYIYIKIKQIFIKKVLDAMAEQVWNPKYSN